MPLFMLHNKEDQIESTMSIVMKDFELLPHTADLKIRIYGITLKELFKNAVIGMFQSIGPHAHNCKKEGDRLICKKLPQKRQAEVAATAQDLLLVDFLSEALYFSDIYNEAYLDAEIHELTETVVKATLHGVAVERFDVVEIKAVTYHDLFIKKENDYYVAEVVFDI